MPGHHSWKEIQSQPEVWREVLAGVRERADEIETFFKDPRPVEEIVVLGCGSSYYLSLSAAHAFQRFLGLPARAVPSSEGIFYPEAVFPKDRFFLAVGVSRSGETTETLVALRRAAEFPNGRLGSVSCHEESGLGELGGLHLALTAGAETSVVMTRSFSSMLLALQAVAALAAGDRERLEVLFSLPDLAPSVLEASRPVVEAVGADESLRRFVFLGSGPLYGIASEAMLKIKEMALEESEAYHSLEYRHGPKSVVDRSTLVVSLMSAAAEVEEKELLKELTSLSARTMVVGPDGSGVPGADGDWFIPLPEADLDDWARALLMVLPGQLLAYQRAVSKGLDPDRPQNLSHVVRLGL